MTEHQYCALTFVGGEAFCVIPHYGAQGPPWAPGPKFLNIPKVRLLDYHYDRTSVLCTNICGRRSILRDSTLWGPGPTMGPGPKIPEHPKVRLLDYHYDRTSVLCTNICGRRSILRDSTLWGPGPTMGPGPKIPEHPEGTAVRLSLWPNISTVH